MKKIKKGYYYHVPTMEAYNDFIRTAEKEGLIWWATRDKPTERPCIWGRFKENTIIHCDYDGTIAYGNLMGNTLRYGEIANEWKAEDPQPTIVEHLIRGNKTIVKLSNGKVGVARCHPDDTFDIYEGLRVATARAYGKPVEEPKVEPMGDVLKVKCIDVDEDFDDWWTVGKVYEKVKGGLVDDGGYKWKTCCRSDNPAEWNTGGMNATFELYEEPEVKGGLAECEISNLGDFCAMISERIDKLEQQMIEVLEGPDPHKGRR